MKKKEAEQSEAAISEAASEVDSSTNLKAKGRGKPKETPSPLSESELESEASQLEEPAEKIVARPAQFQSLQAKPQAEAGTNLAIIKDVQVEVSVELGRTTMKVKDLLKLGPGSVIELNRLAGEPVSMLVNNRLVAHGEVVVIDENFGFRVTQVYIPEDQVSGESGS